MNEKTKILVIDDEKGIRDLICFELKDQGYAVDTVSNGEEGIEKIRKEKFDVVVSDIKMLGMDGIAVLGEIKKIDSTVEVIMATGYATIETAIESLRKGATDYITKPFEMSELLSTVEKAVELRNLKSQLVTLKEMEKLKEEFMSMVSHDLKTPLTAISGAVDVLFDVTNSGETNTKKLLEIIKRQAEKMKKLINDLLDFTRMESGFVELKKQSIFVVELINDAIKELGPLAEKKKVEIKFQGSCNSETSINCDYEYIKRVFLNLLVNAIKYTPDGGMVIVYFKEEASGIKFIIEDNGIGIATENLKKVFEKFYRVDQSLVKSTSGFGLGLSICRKIVEFHGGRIWVESEGINKGSKLIFTLPK
ncbi:MAG: response regulator [Candidatus Firestonebacteria bacterium]